MRVLVTGVDADGRSCVVGEEHVVLDAPPGSSGFWFGSIFETTTAPPTAAELSALAGMQEAAERHTAVTGRDVWERRLSERSAAG